MSHTVYPYQLCYCSICRKTDGGGFAINIMGDAKTLKIEGRRAIGIYRAEIEDENGRSYISTGSGSYSAYRVT